jgi:hypothetical protein
MFRRNLPQPPPEPNQGFPADALVIVIPRVLLDRLLLLVIALALGGVVSIQVWNVSVSGSSNRVEQSSLKP